MKHEIFGISTDNDQQFVNEFDVVFDDYETYLESKETYTQDDDDLPFEYKYCIHVFDWREYESEKNVIGFQLSLVPTFQSLTKEKQNSVLDCCGITADEVNIKDIVSYGIGVPLGYVEVEVDENYNYDINDSKVSSVLNDIASVYETINSLRGFYIDKPVNMLGSTGWDLLRDYVNDDDFIKATLDRYKD